MYFVVDGDSGISGYKSLFADLEFSLLLFAPKKGEVCQMCRSVGLEKNDKLIKHPRTIVRNVALSFFFLTYSYFLSVPRTLVFLRYSINKLLADFLSFSEPHIDRMANTIVTNG